MLPWPGTKVETVNWMSIVTNIDQKTREILFYARNNFLFYQGEIYVMKDNSDFAVPQGGFDKAEVAEMLGLYILHCLRHLPVIAAIYNDDGYLLSRLSPFETECVKKQRIFYLETNWL